MGSQLMGEPYVGTSETEVKQRLDRIENLLLTKQEQRLNDLEARMKKLEDALAV